MYEKKKRSLVNTGEISSEIVLVKPEVRSSQTRQGFSTVRSEHEAIVAFIAFSGLWKRLEIYFLFAQSHIAITLALYGLLCVKW